MCEVAFGASGCRDRSNDLRKVLGLRRPLEYGAGVPPYRASPTASATEPSVLPEASSVKKRGSRPIRVTVGRPKVLVHRPSETDLRQRQRAAREEKPRSATACIAKGE